MVLVLYSRAKFISELCSLNCTIVHICSSVQRSRSTDSKLNNTEAQASTELTQMQVIWTAKKESILKGKVRMSTLLLNPAVQRKAVSVQQQSARTLLSVWWLTAKTINFIALTVPGCCKHRPVVASRLVPGPVAPHRLASQEYSDSRVSRAEWQILPVSDRVLHAACWSEKNPT